MKTEIIRFDKCDQGFLICDVLAKHGFIPMISKSQWV